MSGRSTLHRLCVFLTSEDEARLTAEIRAALPAVRFVNNAECEVTPFPVFRDSLGDCAGRHATFVDTRIVSESAFHRDCVVPHPSGRGWVYGMVGTGLASLLRSHPEESGFFNGELRASVPAGDTGTAASVSALLKLVRTGGMPVFAIDPRTAAIARRAERNFVAWPDAAARFGAKNAASLTNGPTAWYTVER